MSESDLCFDQIELGAESADRCDDWPEDSWRILRSVGVPGWSIPTEFGGSGLDAVKIHLGMEAIASHCLTTAFALSQRHAAVRQLLKGPVALKTRFLPRLATDEIFMTVGLSQLTTSRQHGSPALLCTRLTSGKYQLDGEIPWVTGADQAEAIIVGATLPDSKQLLAVVPIRQKGIQVQPPLPLSALAGSRTSLVRCDRVIVETSDILLGPTDSVMGKIGGGGLDTSCLALGLATAAVRFIEIEAQSRPDLAKIAENYVQSLGSLRCRLHEFARTEADAQSTLSLRIDSTKLALRTSQAALMIAKGVGFVLPHPAQRWARQALFFLVWSCPRPVADGILAEFASI